MSVRKPEEWPAVFEKNVNAGVLESVVDLYEPNAAFVPEAGETIVGRDHIRPLLDGLIKKRPQLKSRVVKAVAVGDIAVLYTDFRGTAVDASEKPGEFRSSAIEVLRRQSDGEWKLIVGDPNARRKE